MKIVFTLGERERLSNSQQNTERMPDYFWGMSALLQLTKTSSSNLLKSTQKPQKMISLVLLVACLRSQRISRLENNLILF